jgi:sulfate adenylyltransferase
LSLSGSEVRREYIDRGRHLPAWYSRPEVAEIIAENYPPRHRQGFCVWFTGLSGSGKSTTAELVAQMLLEFGRQSTVLDGDVVRTHLSKGLGFSREGRDANILRIGFVASEIVRHGGVAICAAVSPYRQTRNDVRAMFPADRFIEVFVSTSLSVCESRDAKGMYAKARRGEIKNFTGVDDVYERPETPEIIIDNESVSAIDNALRVLDFIKAEGFVVPRAPGSAGSN